jgi:hypothetical protein
MTRSRLSAFLVATMLVGVHGGVPVRTQGVSTLAGRWTLSRELSEFPRELGFGMDLVVAAGGSGQSPTRGGRRGRGGSSGSTGGGAGAFASGREGPDDVKRMQQLTAEVRNPSMHLTIVETPSAVTITDDRGQGRTFHPGAKEDVLQLDEVPVVAIAKREAGRLVVLYKVEEGRELRYTYSGNTDPAQLVVDVNFLERGGGDSVRRIYEPAAPGEAMTTAASAPLTAPGSPGSLGRPAVPESTQKPGEQTGPAATAPAPARAMSPASADRLPPAPVVQQPDAELKGLTKLGVVVEGLGSESSTCGLSQGAIEAAVSKSLSGVGLTVVRNSDEDSYVYVNVNTVHLSTGFCVSRYDAFLYTHTMAKLSYQNTAVLVQVSLLHDGGIAGGAPAAHTEGVLKGVKEYVDQMANRIASANKQGSAR